MIYYSQKYKVVTYDKKFFNGSCIICKKNKTSDANEVSELVLLRGAKRLLYVMQNAVILQRVR